ncbi:hypothetical protein TNCV_3589361 [Trichonephila clavipes]|nr:hypothetical protein TNCV_3589361 [Trichonephila clavipes]
MKEKKKVRLLEELIGIGTNEDLKVNRGLPQTENHGKGSMRQKSLGTSALNYTFGADAFAAGGTLNSRRAANPLVWLVEGEEKWEASDRGPECSPSKIGVDRDKSYCHLYGAQSHG